MAELFEAALFVLPKKVFPAENRGEKYPSKAIRKGFSGGAGLSFLNKNKNRFAPSEKFEKPRKTEYNKERKRSGGEFF